MEPAPTPFSPPSGPPQRLFQGPPAKSKFLAVTRLLAAPEATVEKTAGLCGFDCPFHFSRTFKRRFGVPPASYRRVRQVRGFVEP